MLRPAASGPLQRPAPPTWEFRKRGWTGSWEVQGTCPIKGDINRAGERIYHMPWHKNCDPTVIEEAPDERYFWDEKAAMEAGWRKARNKPEMPTSAHSLPQIETRGEHSNPAGPLLPEIHLAMRTV